MRFPAIKQTPITLCQLLKTLPTGEKWSKSAMLEVNCKQNLHFFYFLFWDLISLIRLLKNCLPHEMTELNFLLPNLSGNYPHLLRTMDPYFQLRIHCWCNGPNSPALPAPTPSLDPPWSSLSSPCSSRLPLQRSQPLWSLEEAGRAVVLALCVLLKILQFCIERGNVPSRRIIVRQKKESTIATTAALKYTLCLIRFWVPASGSTMVD